MPGADIGKAYVQIVPSAQGIRGQVQDLLEGSGVAESGEGTGSRLGKFLLTGAKATLAAGAAGLAVVIKQGLEAGGKLEQSFGGLDTIYGDAAAAAKEFAENAAQMGISANTYAEQAVGMGAALKAAFGGDTEKAVQAANTAITDMADNAAKMGTPLESLQAAYQGFAKGQYQLLDNLKLGYGGTKEEMQRLLADAEKFSGVEYDIDNLGDVYEAIHVIQGELGLTGVAAEEGATTLSGSTAAMKASWENLMAAMATGEGLDTAMANFSASIKAFGKNVIRMVGNIMTQMPELIKGLASAAIDNAPEFIASGVELVVNLAAGLIEGLPKFISKLPEVFQKAKAAFSGYDWAGLGKAAITAIAEGLSSLASKIWDAMKEIASQGWRSFLRWITGHSGDIPGGGGDAPAGGGPEVKAAGAGRRAAANAAALGSGMRQPGAAAGAEDLAALLSNLQVIVDVILQGDAGQMFKVVAQQSYVETRRTGVNPLASRG
jgi:hypothetical protein